MLTVIQLARRCRISRATVLYYEREGLLQPARRGSNGYRWYGEAEQARLEAIVAYRSCGIPLQDIGALLDGGAGVTRAVLLKSHLQHLEAEIATLRLQQKAIVALLQKPELMEENMTMTKERWVDIMRTAGFDDAAMLQWHRTFEAMEPAEHQRFLESLGIGEAEIARIRAL